MFSVERSRVEDGGAVLYRVSGEIFFASVDRFTSAFDAEAGRPVIIDVSAAHFWDISGAVIIVENALRRIAERQHHYDRTLALDERLSDVAHAALEMIPTSVVGQAITIQIGRAT